MEELFRIWHCERIVCAVPPQICPLCQKAIAYEDIPPVVSLETLFTNGQDLQGSLSVILKPTDGEWSQMTQLEDDLHIGLSDGTGGVVNYFLLGPIVDRRGWEKCIVVYDVPQYEARVWKDLWTSLISKIMEDKMWSIAGYDEATHNCFDFVIQFLLQFKSEVTRRCGELTELNCLNSSDKIHSVKNLFVNKFVIGKMRAAAKRIKIEQDVAKHGFTVE